MLQALHIQNYALIQQLNLDLESGLTIITGETGAGKSIMLGALGLLLGQRADLQALGDPEKKCVVEGRFALEAYSLHAFFDRYDLDYEAQTIIRREINPRGKSRAFINDTPVNLAQLRELGVQLVDIHSQHETLELNRTDFQLGAVDAFAGQADLASEYRKHYRQYRSDLADLEALREEQLRARKERDYDEFLFQELDAANLENGESSQLEDELETLNHAEDIKTRLHGALEGLQDADENVLTQIRAVRQLLEPVKAYSSAVAAIMDRLGSVEIELDDLCGEVTDVQDQVEYNPERIAELNDRLDQLNNLLHKHGVTTCDALVQIRENLSTKLGSMLSLDDRIAAREKALEKQYSALEKEAKKLAKGRNQAAPGLEKAVQDILSELGMPDARLNIQQTMLDEPAKDGIDRLDFLFSANKGSAPREIQKVASGGELSRLMLAIKAVIGKLTALPTIIFDEIDSGVSGDIAGKMARILKQMSQSMQVLSITHLPQIAASGDTHLKVFKRVQGEQTYSEMRPLSEADRLEEIARMLSGEALTEAALANARELLDQQGVGTLSKA